MASPDGRYLAGVLDPRVGAVDSDAAEKNLAVLDLENFELTNPPNVPFDPGLDKPLESPVVVPRAPQPFVVVSDEVAASLTD